MKAKFFIFLFLLTILIPALSFADGNLKIGNLEIHPRFYLAEKYTDNVYAVPTSDNESERITIYNPGIGLKMPFRRHTLLFDYNVTSARHDEFDEENTTDHNVVVFLELVFGSRFGARLSNVYVKGHEPRGEAATGAIEQFKNNDSTVSLNYKLADTSRIQLDYKHVEWDFKNPANSFREREENGGSFYIYHRILPKTSLFVQYDHSVINYIEIPPAVTLDLDNSVDNAYAGITWEITEKSTGAIKGGYMWKNYEDAALDDSETTTALIDIKHEFSKSTSIQLTGERKINETNLAGSIRNFVTIGGSLDFTQRILRKFVFAIHSTYAEDKFSDIGAYTEKRKDATASGGAALTYEMQDWLKFTVDYTHRQRESNIEGIADPSYRENATMASVNFDF